MRSKGGRLGRQVQGHDRFLKAWRGVSLIGADTGPWEFGAAQLPSVRPDRARSARNGFSAIETKSERFC